MHSNLPPPIPLFFSACFLFLAPASSSKYKWHAVNEIPCSSEHNNAKTQAHH